MKVLLLEEIVLQERSRIEHMINSYEEELAALPKGTLVQKKIQSNSYFYLQYRDGKKMVSKYVGKDEQRILEAQEQLDRRKQVETLLKGLHEELDLANKVVEK
ncbi:MAG: hypothetical protein PHI27_04295 [Eubacteriales bacterium]|nr:hypothetical protein [Eubacteriales bacterium]